MVATKHIRPHPLVPRTNGRARAGAGEAYAIELLLEEAAALGLSAPELAMVLGERAAALAEAAGSGELWVRAESVVVSARVRLGLRAATVARAVAALRAAEDLGDQMLAAGLRTDLAVCARSVGAPLTGLATLRPVLELADLPGVTKAVALCHLVGCLSQFGRRPELDRTLSEADRSCGADDGLDGDGRLLARALLRVGVSSHRRRHGDVLGAADAARTGLGYLEQLDDPRRDGGVVRVRLILQLVCSLLDRGDTANALELAQPVLDQPVRAGSIAPAGWLRLAVATRVLLPSGSVEAAAGVLREGVHSTERHGLHALTAQLWGELAHVEDRLGRPSEAIECLHRGRAAEHLHTRARRQAVGLLSSEFGNGSHAEVDLDDVLGSALAARLAGSPSAEPEFEPEPRPAEAAVVQPPGLKSPRETPGLKVLPFARPQAETPEPVKPVLPLRPARTAVPDPPLAPEPAAEPTRAPAVTASGLPRRLTAANSEPSAAREPAAGTESAISRESGAASESGASRESGAPREFGAASEPATPREPVRKGEPLQRRPREDAASRAKTRHDSEHGSVAARSVLDRLGISAGSGGGRRRAERDTEREDIKPETTASAEIPEPPPSAAAPPAPEPAPEPPAEEGPATRAPEILLHNEWLPRLKLPPSLAPFDDLPLDDTPSPSSTSETPFPSATAKQDDRLGEPFPSESSPLDDDLPPDAGLADLLARALAEHQAGTASAAALVKRLGGQNSGETRTVNGHGRNGEVPGNGRHRGDS